MNENDFTSAEYKEIDLTHYLQVVRKRKQIILGIAGIVLAIVLGLSLFSPRVYTAETIFEVGTLEEVSGTLIQIPIEILEDIHGETIRRKLEISMSEYPEIRSENPKGTRLIKITAQGNNAETGRAVLEELTHIIISEHQERVDAKMEYLTSEIEELEEQISVLEIERKRVRDLVDARRSFLSQQAVITYLAFTLTEDLFQNTNIRLNTLRDQLEKTRATRIIKDVEVIGGFQIAQLIFFAIFGILLGLFLGLTGAFWKEWWDTKSQRRR